MMSNMKKAICDKCNSLISVDQNVATTNCPNCKAQIFTDTVVKNYLRTISTCRRKADIAYTGKADYIEAYNNYKLYHSLMINDLSALLSTTISLIRCSTTHKITIKEATDYLLNGSDQVEINDNNFHMLSEMLKRMRLDAKLIVETFNEIKSESNYALSQYHTAINEYQYYLKSYIEIYQALPKFNKFFDESPDIINNEIKWCQQLLEEKVLTKNNTNAPHDFFNAKHEKVSEIFPNKKRFYRIHILLYIVTGLGAVLSIIGFIFLSTKMNQIATLIILCLGLLSFFGGYFVNHYLSSKNKK